MGRKRGKVVGRPERGRGELYKSGEQGGCVERKKIKMIRVK